MKEVVKRDLYSAVIVGGGVVGSHLASRLAGRGHDVVVLERREGIGEKASCTGIIGRECAEAFSIDGGVVLRKTSRARFFSPSGRTIHVQREATQALIVDRRALDTLMAARARANGARYALSTPVSRVRTETDRIVVETARGDEFAGRVAVITSGFGHRLTEELGLGRVGDYVAGAQADIETGVEEVEVYLGSEIAPGFFGWLVPTLPGKGRVGLLSRRAPGLYLGKLMSSLVAQGKIASAEARINYGAIPLRALPATYADRVIVVGDAAGQVKPTTGGGIYYGLLCADIAADTLDTALNSDSLSARSLAAYQRGWKKKLNRELTIGYQARRFYERLSDRQIDRVFDILVSRGIDKALLEAGDVSFDWHGEAVLRLLGQRAVSRAMGLVKMPVSVTQGAWRVWRRA